MASIAEKKAIARYQRLKRKIKVGSRQLSSYWVDDFEGTYDELVVFLRQLKAYVRILEKYVEARQSHYEQFIKGKRKEDSKHAYWRQALSDVLVDAKKKYDFYQSLEKKQFYQFERTPYIPSLIEYDPEGDYDSDGDDGDGDDSSEEAVSPPPLTLAAKKRRKRKLYKLRKQKEKEEAALLNRFSGRVHYDLPYEYSLDCRSIIQVFEEYGVVIIDPSLYTEETIKYEGDTNEAVTYLLDCMKQQKEVNFAFLLLVDFLTKDPTIRLPFYKQAKPHVEQFFMELLPPKQWILTEDIRLNISYTLLMATVYFVNVKNVSLNVSSVINKMLAIGMPDGKKQITFFFQEVMACLTENNRKNILKCSKFHHRMETIYSQCDRNLEDAIKHASIFNRTPSASCLEVINKLLKDQVPMSEHSFEYSQRFIEYYQLPPAINIQINDEELLRQRILKHGACKLSQIADIVTVYINGRKQTDVSKYDKICKVELNGKLTQEDCI